MRILSNKHGHTLIEVVLGTGLTTLLLFGASAMWIGTMRSYDTTTGQLAADTDAIAAMQLIVSDIREASSFTVVGQNRLRVTFPTRNEHNYYDRRNPDTAGKVDYYLSDETMTPGHSGTYLCKGRNNGNVGRQILARGIQSISFEPDTSCSIKITIVAEKETSRGARSTRLTQRVVYLRNH